MDHLAMIRFRFRFRFRLRGSSASFLRCSTSSSRKGIGTVSAGTWHLALRSEARPLAS